MSALPKTFEDPKNGKSAPGSASGHQLQEKKCGLPASSLVQKVILLEQFIDDLFADLKSIRANIEARIEAASLRSHEEAMYMLRASKSQVKRYRDSGELTATWLDSHPRYKIEIIKAFIDSRTRQGKPIKKSKTPVEAEKACPSPSKKQPNRGPKNAKQKEKELS